jgi:hypothetical protein
MSLKIKIFSGGLDVVEQVNEFLTKLPSAQVDEIKFSSSEIAFDVMVVYDELYLMKEGG